MKVTLPEAEKPTLGEFGVVGWGGCAPLRSRLCMNVALEADGVAGHRGSLESHASWPSDGRSLTVAAQNEGERVGEKSGDVDRIERPAAGGGRFDL